MAGWGFLWRRKRKKRKAVVVMVPQGNRRGGERRSSNPAVRARAAIPRCWIVLLGGACAAAVFASGMLSSWCCRCLCRRRLRRRRRRPRFRRRWWRGRRGAARPRYCRVPASRGRCIRVGGMWAAIPNLHVARSECGLWLRGRRVRWRVCRGKVWRARRTWRMVEGWERRAGELLRGRGGVGRLVVAPRSRLSRRD